MAPLELAAVLHAPHTVDAREDRHTLLWKMEVELTQLTEREMELIGPNQRKAGHSHMNEERAASPSSLTLMNRMRAEPCHPPKQKRSVTI
jgi:hypothetical protein